MNTLNLDQLVKDCLAMDISNMALTFGKIYLPNDAANELAALKAALDEAMKVIGRLIDGIHEANGVDEWNNLFDAEHDASSWLKKYREENP